MSVQTEQRQRAPSEAPAKPKYPVLAEAARICRAGHTTHILQNPQGEFCALGGILAAEGVQTLNMPDTWRRHFVFSTDPNVRRLARRIKMPYRRIFSEGGILKGIACSVICAVLPSMKIVGWNDEFSTKDEVVETMERAAYDL